jgi:hypothetical protein
MAGTQAVPTSHLPSSRASAPPADFEAVWPLVSPIEGWLSKEQGAVLYEGAASVPAGCWIVEVGSWHGRSTVLLAKGKRPTVGLLAVDPFLEQPYGGGEAAYEAFCANLRTAGVESEVQLVRETSEQAAAACGLLLEVAAQQALSVPSEPVGGVDPENSAGSRAKVGLLYVDGAHDRNSVLADVDGWEPSVRPGGLVCFHDAFFRIGVTMALLERHVMNTRFQYLGSVGSLAVFRRERLLSNRAAVSGSLRMLGQLGYFARNMLITPAVRRNWQPLLWLIPPEDSCEY